MSEKSYEKRVKMPVDAIPEARHLAAGWRAGVCSAKLRWRTAWGVYTALAQDARMEVLEYLRTIR